MSPLKDLLWLPPSPLDFAMRCRVLEQAEEPVGLDVHCLANCRLSAANAARLRRVIERRLSKGRDLAPLAPFRLGVVSNATVDFLLDHLPAAAARHGVALQVLAPPYDQIMQQALDPDSLLNTGRLDAVLLALDDRWLQLDRAELSGSPEQRLDQATERLKVAVAGFQQHGVLSIVQTIPALPPPLFGNYDRRVTGTVRALVDEANRRIVALAEETGSNLLDVATLAERVGIENWFDPVQWAAYKLPFSADCNALYADMVGRLLGAIRGKSRKCLVLDLDNTIWGGVIGDDGLDGIVIGHGSALGEAFLSVQRFALDLRERGIMLAVSSKNTDAVARSPFREQPDMLLKEEHITVFQANWSDKPSNLEAIAKSLNIGLDALVLLDDNPAERAHVRAALPMVAVPELPSDPSWYGWYLGAAGYFEAVSFSKEDRLRAESYAADARRAEVMTAARDLGDYLASLEMVMTITPFDRQGRARIAQLINKTNQFNLTTRRYTEAEVAAMEVDASIYTLQVRLNDRFGDLGMIAVVICRPANDSRTWDIDTWLMSCRVLGRKVEEAMLAKLVADARARGIERLIGTYRPTAKNSMVAEHYAKLGFAPIDGGPEGVHRFELSVMEFDSPGLPMKVVETGREPAHTA